MNNKTLTNVALRYRAVFLDINREDINMRSEVSVPVMAFTRRLKETGFCGSFLEGLDVIHCNDLVADAAAEQEGERLLLFGDGAGQGSGAASRIECCFCRPTGRNHKVLQ